jgi:hypothetical protein
MTPEQIAQAIHDATMERPPLKAASFVSSIQEAINLLNAVPQYLPLIVQVLKVLQGQPPQQSSS